MTQEEKAKAYDEALKVLHKYDGANIMFSQDLKEEMFPELKESEDERIRKEIKQFIRSRGMHLAQSKVESWVAWLEKQGEQKPNYCHHEVDLSNCSEEYRKAYYDGWNNCNMQHSQCKSELDAVVKCLINGMKFYYEDNEEATWGTDKWSMPVKYIIEVLEKQCKNNMGISEATKQKLEDNLNKALEKETPESWNEFLEKQAEQKPNANCLLRWSETDEKMFQCLEGIVKDFWAKAEQEKNEIKIREASDVSYFLKTIQKSPLCWIKCSDGLPNRDGIYLVVTDGLHNEVYDIARYDSIEGWHKASEIIYWMPIPQLNNKSIIERKTAWSEEDEIILNDTFDILSSYYSSTDDIVLCDNINKTENWLNTIKDRVQPQPKQEWSEEDWNYIADLISYFDGSSLQHDIPDVISWLKSFRPKSQWKPSDEQIEALESATENCAYSEYQDCLRELIEQLKKLKN